jgi:ATP-dependent RNA helicase RhlB
MSDAHLSQIAFDSLNLPATLKQGIAELGYLRCTPIQAQTLPEALAGHDVAGQAQTGTGKTAAFLVALFNRLLTEPASPNRPVNAPRAIVIAPTRELAVQIHSDAMGIGKYTGLKLAIVFGGVDYDKQRRILEEGVDVLIGTPGRIIDYFKQHVFELRHIQVAVMDEADRMFDLGFIKDIRFILRRLPEPTLRLTMLFSATLSYRVLELAYEHMNKPELIRIEPDKMTVDRVRQVLYFPSTEEKVPLLIGLLRRIDAKRTMVFVNTKRVAELLERTLLANGFVAQALSGDVPQNKRLKMMRDFHNGEVAVLIATDVASRGLHIPDVSHVFNYDLPNDAEDYVHRIGRTARAGAEGDAISFGCEEYAIGLPDIERYIGHQIPRASIEAQDLATVIPPPPAAAVVARAVRVPADRDRTAAARAPRAVAADAVPRRRVPRLPRQRPRRLRRRVTTAAAARTARPPAHRADAGGGAVVVAAAAVAAVPAAARAGQRRPKAARTRYSSSATLSTAGKPRVSFGGPPLSGQRTARSHAIPNPRAASSTARLSSTNSVRDGSNGSSACSRAQNAGSSFGIANGCAE